MANERYKELLKVLEDSKEDFRKFFDKGNKTAGVRLRKKMQLLRSMAKEIRTDIQEKKKNSEPKN